MDSDGLVESMEEMFDRDGLVVTPDSSVESDSKEFADGPEEGLEDTAGVNSD